MALDASAAPIRATAETWAGHDVQTVRWTDRSGHPRAVSILRDNIRIIRQSYVLGDEEITDEAVAEYGIGNLVHHGGCGATVSWESTEDYSAEAVLAGPNHFIWRSTFLLPMCDFPDVRWRVTNEYLFTNGEDSFIQTVAYDSSDLDAATDLFDDMRGPYNQMDWPKEGNITGFGWGSEYRFTTLGPISDGDANVGGSVAVPWTWTEPNVIPYVVEWADPSEGGAVDREVGMVQNQPYVEQDFGGGYYGCGTDCWATPPPLSGDAMPASWAVPTQLSAYDSNYRSGRITWGGVYGAFQNGHANDTGSIPDMGDHFRPVNAWSFTHVIGRHSDDVVLARVRDTENLYASSLTATVGAVRTSGPRGPGDFVGPEVGSMPELSYSNPGLDFVYRTWNIEAEAGAASIVLDVRGTLESPTFVVHAFPEATPTLALDGAQLASEVDAFTSYDPSSARLFITLATTLDEGEHTLAVSADGALPVDDPPEPDAEPEPSAAVDGGSTTGAGGQTSGNTSEPEPDVMSEPKGAEEPEPRTDEPEPSRGAGPHGAEPDPPRPDAGQATDGARNNRSDSAASDTGCDCTVGSRPDTPWVLLLALAALLRRRAKGVGAGTTC